MGIVNGIVRAVAEAEGKEPEEVDFILHNWVDPDALQRLLEQGNELLEVQFRITNHTVIIHSDSSIVVDGEQILHV